MKEKFEFSQSDNEKSETEFKQTLQDTIEYLKRWGIEDLTHTELLYVSKFARECLEENESYYKDQLKNKVSGAGFYHVSEEAAVRWLSYLFGITDKEVPKVFEVTDPKTGEKFTYNKIQVEKAWDKYLELMKKHDMKEELYWAEVGAAGKYIGEITPDDFKKYIKLLREKIKIGNEG